MTIKQSLVQERLTLMRDLLADLEKIGEVTAGRLDQDRIIRHAVERIVTQLVDLSVSINSHIVSATKGDTPTTYRESFRAVAGLGVIPAELAVELAPSAGLRNILIHEYIAVDLELVANAVPAVYEAYQRYVTEVARYLSSSR